jgi:DNA-binding MarR family transcriptional regulator
MDYDSNESIGFIINKAHLILKNNLQKKFKKYDIAPEQWAILNCLYNNEGCSQKELSDKTYKDKASITRILDVLEKRRLVKRESDPGDRRVFLIFITDEGRALRDALIPLSKSASEEAIKGFSQEEFKLLKVLLLKLISNFAV